MGSRGGAAAIDYERLGVYLRALGVPTRLQLLHKLQLPHAVTDIELPPYRKDKGQRADRAISRQAVENHLRKLEALKLVRSRIGRRDGREVAEYVVDHGRLFALVEEVRRLSLIRAAPGMFGDETRVAETSSTSPRVSEPIRLPEGPGLVLVGGPMEGAAFPLTGDGPWTIGRGAGAEVRLAYDPYVSGQNGLVSRTDDGFLLEDLGTARNGTRLNWMPLGSGTAAAVRAGDLIGVGRSLLVFRS